MSASGQNRARRSIYMPLLHLTTNSAFPDPLSRSLSTRSPSTRMSVTGLRLSTSYAVLQPPSTPPSTSNQDIKTAVEEAPGIAPSASPDIGLPVSAAGQQRQQHHHEENAAMVPVDSSRPSFLTILSSNIPFRSLLHSHLTRNSFSSKPYPVPLKLNGPPPCPARHLQERTTNPSQTKTSQRTRGTLIFKNLGPVSNLANPETVAPLRLHSIYGTRSGTPNTSRPTLTLKTQGTMTTRSSGPRATPTSLRQFSEVTATTMVPGASKPNAQTAVQLTLPFGDEV